MILNKIKETKDIIGDVKRQQSLAAKYGRYVTFKFDLDPVYLGCSRFQAMFKRLHSYDPQHFLPYNNSTIIEVIDNIISLLKSGQEVPKKAQLNKIEQEVKENETDLKDQWASFVSEHLDDLVNALRLVKNVLSDPSPIDQIIVFNDKIKNQWPLEEGDLDNFEEKIKEARQIISKLDVGKEIQDFLQLVTDRRARLSDITPGVMKWFQDKELDKNLEITFFNPKRRF